MKGSVRPIMKLLRCVLLGILLSIPIIAFSAGSADFYIVSPSLYYPPLKHPIAIANMRQCESGGKNIAIQDSNGLESYGELMFQAATWQRWSLQSGIQGSPLERHAAREMADWALSNQLGSSWTCYRLLGYVY